MKKYLFLIPFFLFACQKNEKVTKISIRQLPSKISVFNVDIGTGAETLQYELVLFYNDITDKFDSIILAGITYRFDYSLLNTQQKMLLNYTDTTMPYGELIFDPGYYTLKAFNEIQTTPTGTATNIMLYDSINRIKRFTYSNLPADNNFFRSYSYKWDTAFVHSERASDLCVSNDTILNSLYGMSSTLSWLLFTEVNAPCGSIGYMLRALPVSNYAAKLPLKMINGDSEINYTYSGDTNSRLSEAIIIRNIKSTGLVSAKLKIRIVY